MTDTTLAGGAGAYTRLEQIQLDLIAPDPDQVRKHFDAEALNSLSDSLRQNGLIQPIVVRPAEGGKLQIVAGERRFRAAGMAGLAKVPVIVREDLVGKDLTVIQVLENLQREDLTLAETCAGVSRLVESVGFAEAVKQLGKSEAWVSKHASVVGLPDPIKKLVGDGKIDSVDIAKELAALLELNPQSATRMIQRLDPEFGLTEKEVQELRDEQEAEREDIANIENDDDREYEELDRQTSYAHRPLTRADVRMAVLNAKADLEDRAEPQPDPKVEKREAAEKKKRDAERARQTAIQKLYKLCEDLGHGYTRRFHVLAGMKEPTRNNFGWSEDLALEIKPNHFSPYSQVPPATAGAAKFTCDTEGSLDRIEIFGKLLQDPNPKLDMRLAEDSTVTLAEAKAVAKILGKRISFSARVERTGAALQKIVDATPAPQDKAKAQSNAEHDAIVRFLVERTRKATPAHRIKAGELHAAFLAWCKTNKVKSPPALNSNKWGDVIASAGIEKTRSGGIQYLGIKLVGDAMP